MRIFGKQRLKTALKTLRSTCKSAFVTQKSENNNARSSWGTASAVHTDRACNCTANMTETGSQSELRSAWEERQRLAMLHPLQIEFESDADRDARRAERDKMEAEDNRQRLAKTIANVTAWNDGARGGSEPPFGYGSRSKRSLNSEWKDGAYTHDAYSALRLYEDDPASEETRMCLEEYESGKVPSRYLSNRLDGSGGLTQRSAGDTVTEDEKREKLYRLKSQSPNWDTDDEVVSRADSDETRESKTSSKTVSTATDESTEIRQWQARRRAKRARLNLHAMRSAHQDLEKTKTRLGISDLPEKTLDSTDMTDYDKVSYTVHKLSSNLYSAIKKYETALKDDLTALEPDTAISSTKEDIQTINRDRTRPSPSSRLPNTYNNSTWTPTIDEQFITPCLFDSIRLASSSALDTNVAETQSCLLSGISAMRLIAGLSTKREGARDCLDQMIAELADVHFDGIAEQEEQKWEEDKDRMTSVHSIEVAATDQQLHPNPLDSATQTSVSGLIGAEHSTTMDENNEADSRHMAMMAEKRARPKREHKKIEAEMLRAGTCHDAAVRARDALSPHV